MKYIVVAIKDELSGFAQPVLEQNEMISIRNFKSAVNSNENLKANCKDYSLYKLGTYDTDTGKITSKVEKVVDAFSLLEIIPEVENEAVND